jgi:hypothetical protein
MRLSEERIRQGLLNPDHEVRSACLDYFAEGYSRDTSVMPAAVESLERYGRADAFSHTYPLADLAQTEDTIRWVIGELRDRPGHGEAERNYRRHLSTLLCHADPRLLLPHEQEILGSPGFDRDCARPFAHRLTLLSWDGDALWGELEAICEEGKGKVYTRDVRYDEARHVVQALARQGDRHADRMMALLAVTVGDLDNNPMKWMEPLLVRLAGELRHEPAVPPLVARLHQDAEVLSEECLAALVRIGTDGVVRAVRNHYPAGEWHFRLYATGVLGRVHTDLAVAACVELLEYEEDLDLQNWLAQALVAHFSFEGNEAARRVLLGDPDLFDLRQALVTACTLTGQNFPELERWRQEVGEQMRPQPVRHRPVPAPTPKPAPSRSPPRPRTPAATAETKVGRNDPCPCGSGKKFKKCCMGKPGSS